MIVLHAAAAGTTAAADTLQQIDLAAATRRRLLEAQHQRLHEVIADLSATAGSSRRGGLLRCAPGGQTLVIEQQLVGSVHPLELAGGSLRRIAVGMPAHCQPPKGPLDLLARRLSGNAQNGERVLADGHSLVFTAGTLGK